MRLTYGKKNGKKYFYYVCNAALTKGYSKCPTKTVKQNLMEDVIVKKLMSQDVSADATCNS
jgi:hypothetical protein